MAIKIKAEEKLDFFKELKGIYDYGFSISSSFENLHSKIAKLIWYDLKCGKALSETLSKYSFEQEILLLIDVGEQHGMLKEVFPLIVKYYQSRGDFVKKMVSRLSYPVLTVIFSFCILAVFYFYLLPKFSSLYSDFGLATPQVKGGGYGYVSLFLLIIMICILIKYYRNLVNIVVNKFSFFKEIFLVFFFRMLALVNTMSPDLAGVIERIADKTWYPASLYEIAYYLKRGESLAGALKRTAFVNQRYCQLIAQAEYVNNLNVVLSELSAECESRVNSSIDRIVVFSEPVLMIVVGLCVTYISLMILSPVLQMSQGVL